MATRRAVKGLVLQLSIASVFTTVALSISFLVYVIVGQYVFGFQLGWFPVQGWSDSLWTNLTTYAPLPVFVAVADHRLGTRMGSGASWAMEILDKTPVVG